MRRPAPLLTVCRLWIMAMFLVAVPAAHAQSELVDEIAAVETVQGRRVALVIGTSDYGENGSWPSLPNATRDVEAVKAALTRANFEIVPIEANATLSEMRAALLTFQDVSADAEIALFYYAGHGFQYKGQNYLVPRGAPAKVDLNKLPVLFLSVEADVVGKNAARALRMFVFDACRVPGPVVEDGDATRSGPAGTFGVINLPQSVILYSTSPGAKAYDSYEVNGAKSTISPFAAAFTSQIGRAGQPLQSVMLGTKAGTRALTRTKDPHQSPQEVSDVAKQFYFVNAPDTSQARSASGSIVTTTTPSSRGPAGGSPPPDLGFSNRDLATRSRGVLVTQALSRYSVPELLNLADGGNAVAQMLVGTMLQGGIGIGRDLPAAKAMLEKAAEAGPAGQTALAQYLTEEMSDDASRRRGLELFERASKAGWASAQTRLGVLLYTGGSGLVPRDRKRGTELLELAADGGHVHAVGSLFVKVGYDRTAEALRRLAASGDVEADNALCVLGELYGRRASVLPACRTAADAGQGRSQAVLALAYQDGTGTNPKSSDDAKSWARLAYPKLDVRNWADMHKKIARLVE